jgi:hypothetical protein
MVASKQRTMKFEQVAKHFRQNVAPLSASHPGIPSAEVNVKTWHFAFNRLDDLPEILILGREREFLTWLFHAKAAKPWAIGPADLDEYVRVLAAPGAIRAALSYYQTAFSPEGLAQSRDRAERKPTMPVLAFGAKGGRIWEKNASRWTSLECFWERGN